MCVCVCVREITRNLPILQNCILLFKQLSLHLWVPESHDIQLVFEWLIDYPLNSNENLLARVILGGLNWGTKSEVCVHACINNTPSTPCYKCLQ